MQIKEILTGLKTSWFLLEMNPQNVPPTDFGLDSESFNRDFAHDLLKKQQEIIRDTSDYMLFRTGNLNSAGYICLYNKTDDLLDYVIRFEIHGTRFLPRHAVQVALWRSPDTSYDKVASDVFFNYLLPRVGAIMSDSQQTDLGERFWRSRMAEALKLGYRVSFVNLSKGEIVPYDGQPRFREWLKNHWGWGGERRNQYLRYMISKS